MVVFVGSVKWLVKTGEVFHTQCRTEVDEPEEDDIDRFQEFLADQKMSFSYLS